MFVSEELGLGRGGQGADVGLGDTGEMVRQGVGGWEQRGTPCGSSRGLPVDAVSWCEQ